MKSEPAITAAKRQITIHVPNTTVWRPGDLVVHDCDAKRADMLMLVLGCNRQGIYRTRYAFPERQPRPWQRKIWRNTIESLHDPRRFGIVLQLDPFARVTLVALQLVARARAH